MERPKLVRIPPYMSDGDARLAHVVTEDNTNENVDKWKSCHSGPWPYCLYTKTFGPPEDNPRADYEDWVIVHEDQPHDAHTTGGAYWGCGGIPGMLEPLSVEVAAALYEYAKYYEKDSLERVEEANLHCQQNTARANRAWTTLLYAIDNASEV